MSSTTMLRRFRVLHLFGRFDHVIDFEKKENISILIAPNGFGKTAVLSLLKSFFQRDFESISKTQFKLIEFTFSNGKSVVIRKDSYDLFEDTNFNSDSDIVFEPINFGAEYETWRFDGLESLPDDRFLARHLTVRPLRQGIFFDYIHEDTVDRFEVMERYSDELPPKYRNILSIPEWIKEAIGWVECHLIETQRLLDFRQDSDDPRYRRATKSVPVVENNAKDLAQRISQVLRQYANEAQKLDQTFPSRIISPDQGLDASKDEVGSRLDDIRQRREDLVGVGFIGDILGPSVGLGDQLDDEGVRRILAIYADDTEQKLSVFDDLFAKVRLFKKIINEHLLFKTIEIDSENGMRILDLESNRRCCRTPA